MKIIDFILKYNLQDRIELYPSNGNAMWRGEFKNVKRDFKKSVPHIMLDKNKNVIEFFVMDNLIRNTDKFFTNLPVLAKFYEDGNYKEVTDYVFENFNDNIICSDKGAAIATYDLNNKIISERYILKDKFENEIDELEFSVLKGLERSKNINIKEMINKILESHKIDVDSVLKNISDLLVAK